ncbi:MAG: hypothetical protein AAFO93_11145 [Pseudomonadota bacterium]
MNSGIRLVIGLAVAALLASCGADGEPIRPSANVGVSLGSGGLSTSASVGASQGPVSIRVGL